MIPFTHKYNLTGERAPRLTSHDFTQRLKAKEPAVDHFALIFIEKGNEEREAGNLSAFPVKNDPMKGGSIHTH